MQNENKPAFNRELLNDITMIVLSLVSVFLLFFEVLADQSPQQLRTLETADIAIACVFLAEFFSRLARAENRKIFVRRHWWELLASIPISSGATQYLRALNLLRIIRVVRLLRLLRLMVRLKIILDASAKIAEQTHLIYISMLAGLIITSGALGFHYMEAGVNPNVHGLWDSFWWTIVTITTVGYGDIYPVTTGGRVLAIFLMLGGIATFSAVTAFVAANIVSNRNPGD